MADVTTLDNIIALAGNEDVKSYLSSLMDKNSETCKRIYDLDAPVFSRFDITGKVFAVEQSFYTKERSECFFESHVKYVDIQIILDGEELIEVADVSKLTFDKAYDAGKDLITYKTPDSAHRFFMRRLDTAIFFPNDAHMCVGMADGPSRVYKTVLKVPADIFKR